MRDEHKTPAQLKKFIEKASDKHRIKSLRHNVLKPLLITVTALSIIMLIFFNIVILIMLYSGVVSDLNSISGSIEQLSQKDVSIAEDEKEIINIYSNELDRRNVTYDSNIIIYSKDGDILYSNVPLQQSEKNILIKDKFVNSEKNKIILHKIDNDILAFRSVSISNTKYENIIIYASLRSLWSTVLWSNRALLVIIVLAFLCFVLASYIIAHNISKPIKELSEQMELIGDGDFTPVKITDNSLEIQKLTLSINEMLARLDAYNKAHTASIQNLSHDLRTPLMSISGYAEGLKYGVLENTDEACDVIIKESKRLTEVVEKMLILSELDALHQPVNMVNQNLNEFLNEEVKSLSGYAIQNHIKVNCDFEKDNMEVMADSHLLSTIVRNLISNAIRYAENEVILKVFNYENQTHLCVADDGNGLSDEDLKYLFVRYYIGKTGHTGLGLSTAKSAAEYMGCTLTGNNRNTLSPTHPCYKTNGAIFTIVFPQ